MKTKVSFLILLLTTGLLSNCTSSTSKNENSGSENAVQKEGNIILKEPSTQSKSKVLFSNSDLDNAKQYSPEEYPLKTIGHDGGVYDNVDYIIKLYELGNYQIIIWSTEGGDSNPYSLCVVKSGIFNINDGLNITPDWSEPEGDGDYKRKQFKIFEDYTIVIDTEEKTDGKIKKYTNYYRINDKGDFYEVK